MNLLIEIVLSELYIPVDGREDAYLALKGRTLEAEERLPVSR